MKEKDNSERSVEKNWFFSFPCSVLLLFWASSDRNFCKKNTSSQPLNQSRTQSINQSINHLNKKFSCRSGPLRTGISARKIRSSQPLNQSRNQSINQSINHLNKKFSCRSGPLRPGTSARKIRAVSQSINHVPNRLINQSTVETKSSVVVLGHFGPELLQEKYEQ
jgi:hypothetical protein